jgi:hypothetical protein
MYKYIAVCGLICMVFTLTSSAEILTISDIQDATNWGNYFLPNGVDPYSNTYYRYGDRNYDNMSNGISGIGNWGWTHKVNFGGWVTNVSDIISATLTIEAWDVGPREFDLITADDVILGFLTRDKDAQWCSTTFNLGADALQKLVNGRLDIFMYIDIGTSPSCFATTIKKSTLTVKFVGDIKVDPNAKFNIYTFNAVDHSTPNLGKSGAMIGKLGNEQAWLGFNISDIPNGQKVVSANLTAALSDSDGIMSQRTLWYDSNDSWIGSAAPKRREPGNLLADELIGTALHKDKPYTDTMIEIEHNWSKDLVDNYVSLMLTGPIDGSYQGGAVDMNTVRLNLITIFDPNYTGGDGTSLNLASEKIVQVVQDHSTDLTVFGYSVPSFVDWNNDGYLDLLVGQGGITADNAQRNCGCPLDAGGVVLAKGSNGEGMIRIYNNKGPQSDPTFNDFSFAQSLGADLICTPDGCMGCFPRAIYWDGDMRKDLLVGQADGTIKIFLNIGTDNNPTFDGGTFVQVGKAGSKVNINVGKRATPTMVDWNNDGKKDLVVGALDGRIHIFINEGTDAKPDFVTETFAKQNTSDLTVPGLRSSPEIVDLNGDGLKDILTGNTNGQLLFYKNVGTKESPLFSGYTFVESDGIPIDLKGDVRSRPFVCDWNADGYLDVLIGAGDGKVHLYLGQP